MWFEPFWWTLFYRALIKCDLNPSDALHFTEHWSSVIWTLLMHSVSQRTDQVWFEPCWYPLCFTVHWPSVIWTMLICTVLQCSALIKCDLNLLICTVLQCTVKCDLNPADMHSVLQCTGKYDLNLSDALCFTVHWLSVTWTLQELFWCTLLTVCWSSAIWTLQIHTLFYNALSKCDLKHVGLLLQFLGLNTCWDYRRQCARCQSGM